MLALVSVVTDNMIGMDKGITFDPEISTHSSYIYLYVRGGGKNLWYGWKRKCESGLPSVYKLSSYDRFFLRFWAISSYEKGPLPICTIFSAQVLNGTHIHTHTHTHTKSHIKEFIYACKYYTMGQVLSQNLSILFCLTLIPWTGVPYVIHYLHNTCKKKCTLTTATWAHKCLKDKILIFCHCIILHRLEGLLGVYQHLVCMWITYFTFSKLPTLSILEKAYYQCTNERIHVKLN